MLDVVIQSIAVADALKRKSSRRRNKLCQVGVCRSKSTAEMRAKEGPQCLGGQFRDGDHAIPQTQMTSCSQGLKFATSSRLPDQCTRDCGVRRASSTRRLPESGTRAFPRRRFCSTRTADSNLSSSRSSNCLTAAGRSRGRTWRSEDRLFIDLAMTREGEDGSPDGEQGSAPSSAAQWF